MPRPVAEPGLARDHPSIGPLRDEFPISTSVRVDIDQRPLRLLHLENWIPR